MFPWSLSYRQLLQTLAVLEAQKMQAIRVSVGCLGLRCCKQRWGEGGCLSHMISHMTERSVAGRCVMGKCKGVRHDRDTERNKLDMFCRIWKCYCMLKSKRRRIHWVLWKHCKMG